MAVDMQMLGARGGGAARGGSSSEEPTKKTSGVPQAS